MNLLGEDRPETIAPSTAPSSLALGWSWLTNTLRLGAILWLLASLVPGVAHAGDAQLARTLTDRGIERQSMGRHEEALTLFDSALLEFEHPKIRYFRAKTLRALGRDSDALAEFRAIQHQADAAKYKSEIEAFISEIEGDAQRQRLEQELIEQRRRALEAEIAERKLREQAERQLVASIKSRDRRLLPKRQGPISSSPLARLAPIAPEFAIPADAHPAADLTLAHLEAIEHYDQMLTIAEVFSITSVILIAGGTALALGAFASDEPSDAIQQAGLAIGGTGVIAGVVGLVVWPSAPEDPRREAGAVASKRARPLMLQLSGRF